MNTSAEVTEKRDHARRVARNPALLCVHHALMMSLFPMAILTLFQRDHLGMNLAEVMGVQAAFAASLALFEFPSGYLADRIGYRRTLLGAAVLSIIAWAVYTASTGLWSVVLAEVLLGLGLSLVSGTNSAMLYESLVDVGQEREFARWFGRSRFFSQISEGSAALVAGLLFALDVRLPFALMVVVWVVNLGVTLALVEPRFERRAADDPFEHVRSLVHFVAHRAPRLRALFFVAVVLSLASFVPVWLFALYASDAGVPVSWLGPLWAISNYCVALGSIGSNRVGRATGLVRALVICTALIAIGYAGMGLTTAWWGFVFYFAFCFSRGIFSPLIAHAEQQEIPSGDRAGLTSLRSLLFRAGFIVLGPATGALIDRHGQHAVLLGLGGLLVSLGLVGAAWLAAQPAVESETPIIARDGAPERRS